MKYLVTLFLITFSVYSLAQSSGIALGVYEPSQGTSGNAIDIYTNEVGRKPAFAWLPMTWQDFYGNYKQFDPAVLDQFRTRGIMPGLTWEPSKGPASSTGSNQPDFSWQQINSGRYDEYITQFAKDAAAYHYPFILRILHEMDGTWYPWGYGVNGNNNLADFVTAYKHIVDIFRAAGATNVQFVWNPTAWSASNIEAFGDTLKQAYPGDNYVDWIALDGYNLSLDNWRSLQEVFQPSYQFLTSFSNRPMMLFEVGSIENPQDSTAKANWITQGFLTTIPDKFPDVKVAVWFNSEDDAKRDNYAIDTSPNALNAWKQVVASPLYQGSLLTDIRKGNNDIPFKYNLSQNYPNPFNPTTVINYSIPKASFVTIKIYDILGNEITSLVNVEKRTGRYSVNLDASNLASGVYFYQLKAGNYSSIKKMVLLK